MIPINHQNNTILSKYNRISDRSKIGIMLIIEITKLALTGGHIGIMQIIESTKIEYTSAHIGIMLIIEITKLATILEIC